MLISCLFLIFLALWWFSFHYFDRDLVCPAMLLISGYTISVGFAFISFFSFPFNYHLETAFILVAGSLLFLIPAYVLKRFLGSDKLLVKSFVARSVIEICPWILFLSSALLTCVIVLTIFTYLQILKDVTPEVTYVSVIFAMRNYLIAQPEATALKELLVLNQIKKIFLIGGWFLLFVYARNCAVRRSFLKDKGVLLNLFCVLILIGTGGGRAGLVEFILAGVGLYFFFDYLYNGERLHISWKLFVKLIGGWDFGRSAFLWAAVPYRTPSRSL